MTGAPSALLLAPRRDDAAGFIFSCGDSFGMTTAMDDAAAPSKPSASGRELVPIMQSVAAGDRRALSVLYDRTSAKLFGICARLLGEADAEDVLQDVYVTVWQQAGRYDESKASPITWLAVIARNKALDRLRVRRPPMEEMGSADDLPDYGASAFELVEIAQERQRLVDCLDELEERERTMIRAAFLDGATYPELATREAVPLGTMKSWIRRGLLRLRGCLER